MATERDLEIHACSRGFTLVELLVVLAILALLSLLLLGVLRFGLRAWESGVERVAEEQEIAVTQSLLRRLLGQARLLPVPGRARNRRDFLGAHDRLQFLAPLPSRLALGGFYVLSLEMSDGNNSRELVMAWHLYRPDQSLDNSESSKRSAKEASLLGHAEALSLEYFGAATADQDPAWLDSWDRVDALPQLVRVGVEFGDDDVRSWPDLVVALKAADREL